MLRSIIINNVVLAFPDFTKEFLLYTDASNTAVGAVLNQKDNENRERPIHFASSTLNETQQKYSTIEKELYAIIWALNCFRPYLVGQRFRILSDHRPLQWAISMKNPKGHLARWQEKLHEHDCIYLVRKTL